MNKLNKGLVVVAMAGLVFTTNVPSVQVSAASKSCVTSNCNKSNSCTTKKDNCSNSTYKTGTTFNCGNLCYKVTGGNTVACTGFKKGCSNATSCTIPSSVTCNGKTYKVTQIASNAFSNCKNLKVVNCPKSIKSCGTNCFGKATCKVK